MAAILPSLKIDAAGSKYFLPYQVAWIEDDSQMRLAEKSVRIGWTYADAFKNVRKRLRHAKRDYLFSTKDQPTAVEYVQTCYKFCEIYNFTKSVVSHGVENWSVPIFEGDKNTGFTQEMKVGIIAFDNGSRIISFSSNPNAMRAYGGDVGMDEFAFHPDPDALWASASGRITWGYDLGVWSSHNGDDTLFYQFVQEAQAGKGKWSYYRVTMPDAVELGLVKKINQVSGRDFTDTQFLEDCRNRARLEEVYEQEYNCNPKGGTAAIVPWTAIARCSMDYLIARLHLEEKQVFALFGEFKPETKLARELQITQFISQAFHKLFITPAKYRLGFDVAASGMGDLAVIYVDEKKGDEMVLRGLFTCRTEDWDFIKSVLWAFHRRLSALKSAGDETGLGRQICWETSKEFPNIFTPVNFASEKQDMGFALMNQLSVAEKRFPKGEADVPADFFALRKTYTGKKWIFSESKNSHNPASHCDIAWAGALATKADTQNPIEPFISVA